MADEQTEFNVAGMSWRPDGDWRQFPGGTPFELKGVHHYLTDAELFVRWADWCDRNSSQFGLRAERDTSNAHDANAVAVFGVWVHEGHMHEVKIGYVPRDIAADIPQDAPIAAELVNAFMTPRTDGVGFFVSFDMHILLPGIRSGFWKDRQTPFRHT